MSRFRRRLMMAQGGGGDGARLQYVSTDGSAYIDTGVSGDNDNLVIEMKFSVSKFVQYAGLFGNYVNEGKNCWRIIEYDGEAKFVVSLNTRAGGSAQIDRGSGVGGFGVVNEFVMKKNWISIGGNTMSFSMGNGDTNNSTICLGNSSVAPGSDIGLCIYSFKISNGDTPLLDYIPWLSSDNVPGFLDLVTNTFKASDTATPFTAGSTSTP